jgi:hypothetical protein
MRSRSLAQLIQRTSDPHRIAQLITRQQNEVRLQQAAGLERIAEGMREIGGSRDGLRSRTAPVPAALFSNADGYGRARALVSVHEILQSMSIPAEVSPDFNLLVYADTARFDAGLQEIGRRIPSARAIARTERALTVNVGGQEVAIIRNDPAVQPPLLFEPPQVPSVEGLTAGALELETVAHTSALQLQVDRARQSFRKARARARKSSGEDRTKARRGLERARNNLDAALSAQSGTPLT